ncbi:MFS transporter [Enterococcus faecium]|uniref:MFS transporter n=1 Tax=Enterococcus faecium TaxID=1352 RepID=UPI003158CB6F
MPSLKEMFDLMKLPQIWTIIIFVVFTWTFYTIFEQQMFPAIYTGMYPRAANDSKIYGTLNAIEVFSEALIIGIVPNIMRKLEIRNTLLLCVTRMYVRIRSCRYASTSLSVSSIKMLHACEVQLFI